MFEGVNHARDISKQRIGGALTSTRRRGRTPVTVVESSRRRGAAATPSRHRHSRHTAVTVPGRPRRLHPASPLTSSVLGLRLPLLCHCLGKGAARSWWDSLRHPLEMSTVFQRSSLALGAITVDLDCSSAHRVKYGSVST